MIKLMYVHTKLLTYALWTRLWFYLFIYFSNFANVGYHPQEELAKFWWQSFVEVGLGRATLDFISCHFECHFQSGICLLDSEIKMNRFV
jgi:hypothetical protein